MSHVDNLKAVRAVAWMLWCHGWADFVNEIFDRRRDEDDGWNATQARLYEEYFGKPPSQSGRRIEDIAPQTVPAGMYLAAVFAMAQYGHSLSPDAGDYVEVATQKFADIAQKQTLSVEDVGRIFALVVLGVGVSLEGEDDGFDGWGVDPPYMEDPMICITEGDRRMHADFTEALALLQLSHSPGDAALRDQMSTLLNTYGAPP